MLIYYICFWLVTGIWSKTFHPITKPHRLQITDRNPSNNSHIQLYLQDLIYEVHKLLNPDKIIILKLYPVIWLLPNKWAIYCSAMYPLLCKGMTKWNIGSYISFPLCNCFPIPRLMIYEWWTCSFSPHINTQYIKQLSCVTSTHTFSVCRQK